MLDQIPKPPAGVSFHLLKVERVSPPHPYCITPKHVAWASDHWSGLLGADAIRDAEKNGAACDICRKLSRKLGQPVLPFDEHTAGLALFIGVPQNRDLNAIPGLGQYLASMKADCQRLGIGGFAFPVVGQA